MGMAPTLQTAVMPGLVPGIHVDPIAHRSHPRARPLHVDGRDKPGHDGGAVPRARLSSLPRS